MSVVKLCPPWCKQHKVDVWLALGLPLISLLIATILITTFLEVRTANNSLAIMGEYPRSMWLLTAVIVVLQLFFIYRLASHYRLEERSYIAGLEDMARQADKFMTAGDLAAGLAHEIRNPITSINGFMQLMQQRYKDARFREFAEIVTTEVHRVEKLIEEFLCLAKPSKPCFALCDLKRVIQDVVLLSQSKGILHNVEIYNDCADDLPMVYADVNRLKQVFINITTNAIQAANGRGELRIRANYSRKSKDLQVQFVDNGCGIPPELLKRLGKRFVSGRPGGTGVGLALSYKIIEQHGGHIAVESTVGKGTVFTVVLPTTPCTANKNRTKANIAQ